MIDFTKLVDNQFLNPAGDDLDVGITPSRLSAYTIKHRLQMDAENGDGRYDEALADVGPKHTTVEELFTDVLTKDAVKEGKVQLKEGFRATLAGKIRRLFNIIAGEYGDPSGDLTACFPQGRNVFQRCKDEELDNKLGQLKNAITARAATLGVPRVEMITNLQVQWAEVYGERGEAGAAAGQSEGQKRAALLALAGALQRSLLTVAWHNIGNPAALLRLCPQPVLRAQSGPVLPAKAVITPGAFEANTMQVGLGLVSARAKRFRLSRRLVGGEFALIATVEADGNGQANYVDTVPAFGSYEYEATAENDEGDGAASEVAGVLAE